MNHYNVIGIMSGTSLDGIDICYCSFVFEKSWKFLIKKADTVKLEPDIKNKLKNICNNSAIELALLNNLMGNCIGNSINNFIIDNKIKKSEIDFIASHGHTIFHQPEKKLTLQIGNGANIATICELPVICDFRSNDIALNGNGAPLVPIGDEILFSEYEYCLNLGGIANISYKEGEKRIAYDICATNMVLNYLANKVDKEYDKNGTISKSGEIVPDLLQKLNNLEFYKLNNPKSLGFEWVSTNVFPLIESTKAPLKDLLRTYTEHIATQITDCLKNNGKIIITGGGTHNNFLVNTIKEKTKCEVIIPSKQLIDFKEALIFGFLGLLRWELQENTLKSVTGATKNSIGGCIYMP